MRLCRPRLDVGVEWLAAARVAPTVEQIKASEPGTFVNYHRVRIDPIKAQNTDAMIRFEFTDASNKPVALHVRRGVVEYVEDPDRYFRKPDFTIALTRETSAKLYLSEATVQQLVANGFVPSPVGVCAGQRRRSTLGANPTRQPLQPEATLGRCAGRPDNPFEEG